MRLQLRTSGVLPVPFGLAVLACLVLVSGPFAIQGGDSPPPPFCFRLVLSEGLIGAGVNENDAKLAIQAWKDAVVKREGFLMDVHVSGLAKALGEIRAGQVDGFSMTVAEFLQVENYASQNLIVDETTAGGGDEYLLLVHDDSGLRNLADLRRKSVNIFDNPKMCLAAMWLETLFASANLGRPQDFLGRMSSYNKLSGVVLPVYFRQADACLVTRRGFNALCELNPQVGRKLRAVATSPRLATTLMAFHKECLPERRRSFQNTLISLHKSVAGQQALTLFEGSRLVTADVSVLRSGRELVKEYDRIHSKAAMVRK